MRNHRGALDAEAKQGYLQSARHEKNGTERGAEPNQECMGKEANKDYGRWVCMPG